MSTFILWLIANPLFFIGAIISFVACLGFLIFLRGFLLGLNQLFYIDGHDDFVALARIRVTWGLVLMVNMFVLWVAVRGVATLLGFDTVEAGTTMRILVPYALVVVILYFMGLAFPKKEAH